MELIILYDWILAAVRWLHVVIAMGWIGTSFYFIALDLGLNRGSHNPEGVAGDEWQVHGGGFYHVQKYSVAPDKMPAHLTWFKWESYATWLSGAALMMLMYYMGAELYMIDHDGPAINWWQASLISAASLGLGWVLYDRLCKLTVNLDNNILMIGLFAILVGFAYFYTSIFTGRAAMLHLGALTATIMTGNVFFLIMPNQRITVEDLKAGRKPDPIFGIIAKQRSTHNNYLTLPVIFLMLSNHYPMVFATDYSWIIASLIFLIGVVIRIYFNTYHARKGALLWPWVLAFALLAIVIMLSMAPAWMNRDSAASTANLSPSQSALMERDGFELALEAVQSRCTMCHAAEPVWQGLAHPPKGVILEHGPDLARQGKLVYLNSAVSHAMPPGNIVGMTDEERLAIRKWFEG